MAGRRLPCRPSGLQVVFSKVVSYRENAMEWSSSLTGQGEPAGSADPRRHNTVLTARQAATIGILNSTFVLGMKASNQKFGNWFGRALSNLSRGASASRPDKPNTPSQAEGHTHILDRLDGSLQAPNSTQIFTSQPDASAACNGYAAASPWITLSHVDLVHDQAGEPYWLVYNLPDLFS